MFKVNNKDTRTTWCRSGVFIVNIFHTLCVSVVNFEHVIASWDFTAQNIKFSVNYFVVNVNAFAKNCEFVHIY